MKLRHRGADNDTVPYGTEPPFETWESDHTALVHVLWHAGHSGLTLQDDADKIATLIRASRYTAAVKHAAVRDADQVIEEPDTRYAIFATDGSREIVYVKRVPEAEPFASVDEAREHLAGEGGTAGQVRAWAAKLVLNTEL